MSLKDAAKPSAPPELDATDQAIIDVLREGGRLTNQEIAERLSITRATVSTRIRRLEEMNAMRVVAVSDFSAHGYNILIALAVQVHGRRAEDVAEDLARLPEVFSIHLMTGPHDLELLIALKDFSDVNLFLHDHLAKIPGISHMEPGIAAEMVKFEFNVAPL